MGAGATANDFPPSPFPALEVVSAETSLAVAPVEKRDSGWGWGSGRDWTR